MNKIGSAEFRRTYATLTESAEVTALGRVIGIWSPTGVSRDDHEHEYREMRILDGRVSRVVGLRCWCGATFDPDSIPGRKIEMVVTARNPSEVAPARTHLTDAETADILGVGDEYRRINSRPFRPVPKRGK